MKAINKACQILAIALSAAALVLFFVPFVTIVAEAAYEIVGAQLAFGGNIEGIGGLFKSAHIWFCFFLTLFSVLFAALTFKFKGMRYAAPVVAVVDAVYMLVIALNSPATFVDYRPFESVTSVAYTWAPLAISIALFAAFAAGAAHLFVDDLIFVRENKGKRTIIQRFIQFLRDYKSEVKKIVWPGIRDVAKNTLIVLILSALVGVFIWLLDWGLGLLMQLISSIA